MPFKWIVGMPKITKKQYLVEGMVGKERVPLLSWDKDASGATIVCLNQLTN